MSRVDLNKLFPWSSILPAFIVLPIYFLITMNFDLYYFLGTIFCFFLFDNLGIQIGVHKLMAHKSFETSSIIRRTLAFLSILSGQGSPIMWVAIHMSSHHPKYDTVEDIHSPIHGKFYAFLSWYWKCDITKVTLRGVIPYIRDKYLNFAHKHHVSILLCWWLLLFILLGTKGLVYLGLLPAFLSISIVGLVNCFMHQSDSVSDKLFFKYQNYKHDHTFNSIILGALTMGLGLHNNHHQSPSSAIYQERWFEVDLSKYIIPLLSRKT